MIKTVIFDFDGTIADTWEVIIKLLKKHRENLGLPEITAEIVSDFRSKGFRELILKYNFILLKLPFIIPKVQRMLNDHIKEVKLFPEMKNLLNSLKSRGNKIGILTTNTKENVETFLRFHEINFFDFIHSGINLLGKDKALQKLLVEQKLNPEETIYVGDEVRDIDACKENGIKIIAVTWGFNTKEILKKNKPDYLIDKPSQVLEIVYS